MIHDKRVHRLDRHHFYASPGRFFRTLVFSTLFLSGCELLPREGDTEGEQRAARWEWSGRLVVDTDPVLTVVRIRLDTAGVAAGGRHDVILARFDFDPAAGAGDEYSLTVGLDLGRAKDLPVRQPLHLGPPPAEVPAYATVTCLCRPLRPDSARGSFIMLQRGLRQITARIDARFYFTAWDDSAAHEVYVLRQKFFGVK